MRLYEIKSEDCIFEVIVRTEDKNGKVRDDKMLYTMKRSRKNEDIINGNKFDDNMKNKIEKRFYKMGYKNVWVTLSGVYFPNKIPYNMGDNNPWFEHGQHNVYKSYL